ncbi:hypothetical protein N9Z11_02200 [Mariniblastus sp.]|nr:hypothetical protein [Mariniblastus sp.]
MNLSTNKLKILDRPKRAPFNALAEQVLDGGIDYLQSPQKLQDCEYVNQVHQIGDFSVRIRMPDIYSIQLISIVSSRIGKNTDQKSNWFDALRTLAVQQRKQNICILTAPGATTFPYLYRLSELFGLTLISLIPLTHQSPTKSSNYQQKCLTGNFPNAIVRNAFYDWHDSTGIIVKRPPSADQLIINLSQNCFVISCRKKGIVHHALKARLQKRNSKRTRLLIDRQLTSDSVSTELINQGAIPWLLYKLPQLKSLPQPSKQNYLTATQNKLTNPSKPATSTATQQFEGRRFLIHWTRQSTGPWPEQPNREFLDDLLFNSHTRGQGALSTLKRIVEQQKIKGTNRLTKGKERLVCLTAVPLSQYANRRIFRSHLGRWDFEHYGIAIDFEFLKKLGARQVNYGTESDWNRLSTLDRPFFQLQSSTSTKINWRAEREWRLRGDLDLKKVPQQMAFIFVKTNSERTALKNQSRWPVVTVENLENLNRLD